MIDKPGYYYEFLKEIDQYTENKTVKELLTRSLSEIESSAIYGKPTEQKKLVIQPKIQREIWHCDDRISVLDPLQINRNMKTVQGSD